MLKKIIAFTRNDALAGTFGYYLMFICLGLGTGITGPTLLSLAKQTNSTIGTISWLFLLGSIGYTLGTIIGGRIFDRVRGHPVLGAAQLVVAALTICMPLSPWFLGLIAIVFCMGIANGIVNTGANTLLVWTHKEKAAPYMNALHFFFGLGAFLSPLLVAQVTGFPNGYRWVYWALAIFEALVGLRLFTLKHSPDPVITPKKTGTTSAPATRIPYPLVFAAMMFLFFYVGAEITFGGWVYTYAVTLGLASAAAAAYMNSGFWLSFTIGRLISIPMAIRFSPRKIIPVALVGCLAILSLIVLFPGAGWVLWVVVIGLGFCMAPIWPSGFTLAGQSLNLTARLSSIVLLGDSFGGMLLPWLVGQVIDRTGPPAMIYLVLGSLALNLLAFTFMLRLRPATNSIPSS